MSGPKNMVVLHGDQTGEELLLQALRLLERDVIGAGVTLQHYDLSLSRRRATRNQVVLEAAGALREAGFGLKAATITPEDPGDVGSPNAVLRAAVDGRVIVRTGRRIPGVRPPAAVYAPISVIRMAVDDAYGAREWREGDGLEEWAYRTERVSRRTCRIVAEYAFAGARPRGQERRQPDGDDPGRRERAALHAGPGVPRRVAGDLRGDAGGGVRRRQDGGPGRPRQHDRLRRRGRAAGPDQGGGLELPGRPGGLTATPLARS